jgi:cation diffusion facilitator CzcD-associated flavoprotein CzcO
MANKEGDAVIVGAGFSGLYATHRLRNRQALSVQCFDAGQGRVTPTRGVSSHTL